MDTTHTLDDYFKDGAPCLLFNVEELSHTPPYDNHLAHRHEYYEIYLYQKGQGKHTIDFTSYDYRPGCVSVVFPHQIHQLKYTPDSRGHVIMFNEELFCSEMLRKELRAYCVDLKTRLNLLKLSEAQFSEIQVLFQLIQSAFNDLNVLGKEQIRHLIKVILLKLMDYSKTKELSQQETSESDLYYSFSNLVDLHFKEKRLVSEFADLLSTTPKKLNAISKKYGGITALQVIHERIFQEAKHLLAFSGLSHKEIAYQLKFDSPSALNKFIQKKAGCSPSDLQNRLTQIYIKQH
ncbi:AraC family transcriptional regulator [Sunxiuqinia sp. sy24]|uniref:AraC family transcriptional regulator n=1 Tax=Sunxiuqinia sp. sy24 TaxID=3461495 RepID=UPI004045B466